MDTNELVREEGGFMKIYDFILTMKIKFFILLMLFVPFAFSCTPGFGGIKYVFPGETQTIEKADIEAVRGIKNDPDSYSVRLIMTGQGQRKHHEASQKYAGNYVSIYFGNTLLWSNLYMPEPMNDKEMNIVMPSRDMMWEVIRYYSDPEKTISDKTR